MVRTSPRSSYNGCRLADDHAHRGRLHLPTGEDLVLQAAELGRGLQTKILDERRPGLGEYRARHRGTTRRRKCACAGRAAARRTGTPCTTSPSSPTTATCRPSIRSASTRSATHDTRISPSRVASARNAGSKARSPKGGPRQHASASRSVSAASAASPAVSSAGGPPCQVAGTARHRPRQPRYRAGSRNAR